MKLNFNKKKISYMMDENHNFYLVFIGLMILTYSFSVFNKNLAYGILGLDYKAVVNFQIWKFFTYSFLSFSVFDLIFSGIAILVFAHPIETEIGSLRFLMFYLVMSLLMGVSLLILSLAGLSLFWFAGFSFFRDSIFLCYATLYPKNTLYIYGILPIPVFVLVIVMIGLTLVNLLFAGGFAIAILSILNLIFTSIYLKLVLKLDVRDIFRH